MARYAVDSKQRARSEPTIVGSIAARRTRCRCGILVPVAETPPRAAFSPRIARVPGVFRSPESHQSRSPSEGCAPKCSFWVLSTHPAMALSLLGGTSKCLGTGTRQSPDPPKFTHRATQ